MTNTKLFSWGSEKKVGTVQKLSPYIRFLYKFVLKSIKRLNQIFSVIQYSFKALECQIWWTNIKLFFWKSRTNLRTLQTLSAYMNVSHKLVLKSVKSVNQIFWVIEYWFKALEYQVLLTNRKPFFFGKWGRTLSFPQILPLYCSFLSVCFEACKKPKSNLLTDWISAKGFRMAKLLDEDKLVFLENRQKPWNIWKAFS